MLLRHIKLSTTKSCGLMNPIPPAADAPSTLPGMTRLVGLAATPPAAVAFTNGDVLLRMLFVGLSTSTKFWAGVPPTIPMSQRWIGVATLFTTSAGSPMP